MMILSSPSDARVVRMVGPLVDPLTDAIPVT